MKINVRNNHFIFKGRIISERKARTFKLKLIPVICPRQKQIRKVIHAFVRQEITFCQVQNEGFDNVMISRYRRDMLQPPDVSSGANKSRPPPHLPARPADQSIDLRWLYGIRRRGVVRQKRATLSAI